MRVSMLMVLAACSSDYKVSPPSEAERTWASTTSDDDDDVVGDDDDDAGDDDDSLGDDDDSPGDDDDDSPRDFDDDPDPHGDLDCANGTLATWLGGELIVFSDDPPQAGVLDVPSAGLYDVYDLSVAESGSSQTNESAFLRVPNPWDSDGLPAAASLTNCMDDWVALDPDNVAPPTAGTTQYMGTFHFLAGHNDVELHHYCEHYFDGECSNLHDPGTTCESGINSVHFLGTAVCLVEVDQS